MIVARDSWPHHRTSLEGLFEASFGKTLTPGFLDWRYVDNEHSQLLFSIAEDKGVLASSYSACPVVLSHRGRTFVSGLSMTTMTHPAYRGRGLFPLLAGELYDYMASEGYSCVWGFPNQNSHRTFVDKLQWTDLYEIPTLVSETSTVGARFLNRSVVRDDHFDRCYHDCNPTYIAVRKTRTYLRWRYAHNPQNQYRNYVLAKGDRVSSYIVAKTFRTGLDLVDIQAADQAEASVLLSHMISEAHVSGLRNVNCWIPPHHFSYGVAERLGFQHREPITFLGVRVLRPGALPEGWDNFRSWFLQMGDSDVY